MYSCIFFPKESAYLFFRFSQSMSSLNFFRKKRKYFFRELQKFFACLLLKVFCNFDQTLLNTHFYIYFPTLEKVILWSKYRLNSGKVKLTCCDLSLTKNWPRLFTWKITVKIVSSFLFFSKKKRFYTFNFFSCFSDFIYLEI